MAKTGKRSRRFVTAILRPFKAAKWLMGLMIAGSSTRSFAVLSSFA
jgi:hypothetical protein